MSSPCSQEADRIKDIHSPVAGEADILLAPDLETDDMLAKQLSYRDPRKKSYSRPPSVAACNG